MALQPLRQIYRSCKRVGLRISGKRARCGWYFGGRKGSLNGARLQRRAIGSGRMPRLNRLVRWRARGEHCVPAAWSVPFEQGGVDWQRAAECRCPQLLLPALRRHYRKNIAAARLRQIYRSCKVLVLGEVVNGRDAVGTSEGEKAAEWRRGTKTRERLRPYAAAESLGTLASAGRTLRTCGVERTF